MSGFFYPDALITKKYMHMHILNATVTLIQCQVASKCMISVGQFQVSIPKIDILFEKLIISQYSTIFAVNASRIPRFMVCCDIVQRILVWIMNIDWFSQFSVYEKFQKFMICFWC